MSENKKNQTDVNTKSANETITPSSKKSMKRRKLVRTVATTGGVAATGFLGGAWVKPVVESVVLPAHAQTTGGGSRARTTGGVTIVDNGFDSILDIFISTAVAAAFPRTFCVDSPANGQAIINIAGGSSSLLSYTSGASFGPVAIGLFTFTNIVINDGANTFSATISCDDGDPKKTDPTRVITNAPLVSGTCV